MPDFTHNTAFMREIDPSGKLEAWAKKLMDSHNNAARQANVAPVGSVEAPPQISSLQVTAAGGVHAAVITDNNPVNQGIIYHFERSSTPDFQTGTTHLAQSGPSRSLTGHFAGNSDVYWRGYSQYQSSPPSAPVYFGSEAAPTKVNAGGAIAGPTPPASTGSGTDQGVLPQGGLGFGPGADTSRSTDNSSSAELFIG